MSPSAHDVGKRDKGKQERECHRTNGERRRLSATAVSAAQSRRKRIGTAGISQEIATEDSTASCGVKGLSQFLHHRFTLSSS